MGSLVANACRVQHLKPPRLTGGQGVGRVRDTSPEGPELLVRNDLISLGKRLWYQSVE